MAYFCHRKYSNRYHLQVMSNDIEHLYTHNVLTYNLPPTESISLDFVEKIVCERYSVLHILQYSNSKYKHTYSDEWQDYVISKMKDLKTSTYIKLINGNMITESQQINITMKEARRRDYISHFLLRLAFCQSSTLRQWFLNREMDLFTLKFLNLSINDKKNYLKMNNLNYLVLTKSENKDSEKIIFENSEYDTVYRVHFTDVPTAIFSRKCYVNTGYAYVGIYDFVEIISNVHKIHIEKGLDSVLSFIPNVKSDERIWNLLELVLKVHENNGENKSDYNILDISNQKTKLFPLCMQQCNEVLQKKNHLNHLNRIRYGLFLKEIGVNLQDALR